MQACFKFGPSHRKEAAGVEGWEGGGGSGLAARLMGNAGLTAGLVLPKERGTNLPQARFFANDNISRGIFLCFTSCHVCAKRKSSNHQQKSSSVFMPHAIPYLKVQNGDNMKLNEKG